MQHLVGMSKPWGDNGDRNFKGKLCSGLRLSWESWWATQWPSNVKSENPSYFPNIKVSGHPFSTMNNSTLTATQIERRKVPTFGDVPFSCIMSPRTASFQVVSGCRPWIYAGFTSCCEMLPGYVQHAASYGKGRKSMPMLSIQQPVTLWLGVFKRNLKQIICCEVKINIRV